MERILWTPETTKILVEMYPNNTSRKIAQLLNRSERSILDKANRMKLKKAPEWKDNPDNGQFKKGHKSGIFTYYAKGNSAHNKGKKQSDYMSAEAIAKTKSTQFQRGHKPKNTKHDGYITQRWHSGDKCFYKYIRIGNANWIPLHRKVWIDANGPIPAGYKIRFKDMNRDNCELSNLEMITTKDNMLLNSIHTRYPEEVKQAILKLGHLKRVINGKEQNH